MGDPLRFHQVGIDRHSWRAARGGRFYSIDTTPRGAELRTALGPEGDLTWIGTFTDANEAAYFADIHFDTTPRPASVSREVATLAAGLLFALAITSATLAALFGVFGA